VRACEEANRPSCPAKYRWSGHRGETGRLQGATRRAPASCRAGAAHAATAALSVPAAPGLKLIRMAGSAHDLRHLTPAAQRLGGLFAHPKLLAIGCLGLLGALGWVYLGLMLAGMERPQALGPGKSALDTALQQISAVGPTTDYAALSIQPVASALAQTGQPLLLAISAAAALSYGTYRIAVDQPARARSRTA
jgi:hypothetical protein